MCVKLTTDRHEASRGLFATAELLVPLLNIFPEIPLLRSPLTVTLNTGGVYKICVFRPIPGYMLETTQDKAIVTMQR